MTPIYQAQSWKVIRTNKPHKRTRKTVLIPLISLHIQKTQLRHTTPICRGTTPPNATYIFSALLYTIFVRLYNTAASPAERRRDKILSVVPASNRTRAFPARQTCTLPIRLTRQTSLYGPPVVQETGCAKPEIKIIITLNLKANSRTSEYIEKQTFGVLTT